jgi:hypothetical protein
MVDVDAKIEKTGNCWVWTGAISTAGYGTAWDREEWRKVLVHRVVFERDRGPIPEGLQLDHLCRNTACCNPFHLEPVTVRENVVRGLQARGRWDRCSHGHKMEGDNLHIGPGGRRVCRACRRDIANRFYQRRRAQ